MAGPDRRARHHRPDAGLTYVELMFGASIMIVFVVAVYAIAGSQRAVLQNEITSRLRLRAQNALERVVSLASHAVTSDSQFSPLKDTTGVNSHCLRFRQLISVDPVTGAATYDDALKVYIYGPHSSGAQPNAGLIIGRGPDLTQVYNAGRGPDTVLGTQDDDTSAVLAGTVPAVELLLPSDFAPQTGEMFTVNVSPAPIGRLLTFTLRVNATEPDGTFVLNQDLVLTERIALRE